MRFLLDNNLSPHLAGALNSLATPDGDEVLHLRDKFAADAKDEEWIRELGDEGDWTIISGDLRIWKNRHEREALRQSKVTTFFLGKSWTNRKFWEIAWRLVRWWPFVAEMANKVEAGAIFEVPLNVGAKSKFKVVS